MPVTSKTFVRATVALLLLGFLTASAIVAASLWLVDRTDTYASSLTEVMLIRREAFTVINLVGNAETGRRGYLLTQEERYLQPYEEAVRRLDEEFARLRELAAARPEYSQAVERLAERVAVKLAELDESIALARAGRLADALDLIRSGRGEMTMDEVRAASSALVASTDAGVAASTSGLRDSAGLLSFVVAAGGAITLLVVGGSAWVARNYAGEIERARLEVLALNETLEARVRERTADLARANEEIQRFAYIVSHDLRAPLVNVMGFTSELEAGIAAVRAHIGEIDADSEEPAAREARLALEEEMPEAIGFIRSSTSRMDNLISAILRLSREGRRKLTAEPVDMEALLQTAAQSVLHQLSEHDGEIDVVTPVPGVHADRLALEQVFGNLLDNAVKYLDRRRPGRIRVAGRLVPEGVEYEVADNGRGIAPEDHERIFELFRRAGAQEEPGEGIGLSHVRALVRRMGGDVTLESELGKGTTFRVRLPRTMRVYS